MADKRKFLSGGSILMKAGAPRSDNPEAGKKDRTVLSVVSAFAAAAIIVTATFAGLISNYKNNTIAESASHLIEINQELRLYVEAKIAGDWNAAHSIANSVDSGHLGSDEAFRDYILREREIWGVSDITVFTESGYAYCADGDVLDNDVASETVARAKRSGEYMTVMQSTLTFVIPIETESVYASSRVVAVSVVQDLSTFLDNMGISSFGGTGFLYLTQKNGAVVSKQTHGDSDSVYNLLPLLQSSDIRPLSGSGRTAEDMLTSEDSGVYLRCTENGNQYIVASPVNTDSEEMRLFYFAPASVVNRTADSFSRYITLLGAMILLVFISGAVAVFLFLYNARKKQFSKALADREHMLDLLVKNSKSAFALLNAGGHGVTFRSGNDRRIIGEDFYSLERTGSGFLMKSSSGADTDALRTINEQLADWDGGGEFRSDFLRNASSPVPAYFEIQIFPLANSWQKNDFIAIAQDVTPLYERQAAASEALAMAEQANQAKTRFLSNMSHDIRTPMNAIVNMTDFAIESAGDPDKQREYLNTLRESSLHLLHLINDVLDMSRIESGRLTIANDPFDLNDELARTVDTVRPLFTEKEQDFICDFDKIKNPAVTGDPVKLSQILTNLLLNACKFTPERGSVRFTAEELPSLKVNVVNIRFTVSDTGIGIPESEMKNIFEPFTRADNKRVSRVEGTGLGLSICRSYVAAMGGTLNAESRVGQGSVFTSELFFGQAQTSQRTNVGAAANADTGKDDTANADNENADTTNINTENADTANTDTVKSDATNADTANTGLAAPAFPDEPPFAGKRCLLCEDNALNRTIALKLLSHLGFTADIAENGREGAEKFAASAPDYYDLIYMDVSMPVLDGYQATAAIRNSAHPRAKTVPIIAMTANVFAEDVERARAAGMNGHLGKPILVPELIQTTKNILLIGG